MVDPLQRSLGKIKRRTFEQDRWLGAVETVDFGSIEKATLCNASFRERVLPILERQPWDGRSIGNTIFGELLRNGLIFFL